MQTERHQHRQLQQAWHQLQIWQGWLLMLLQSWSQSTCLPVLLRMPLASMLHSSSGLAWLQQLKKMWMLLRPSSFRHLPLSLLLHIALVSLQSLLVSMRQALRLLLLRTTTWTWPWPP